MGGGASGGVVGGRALRWGALVAGGGGELGMGEALVRGGASGGRR